MNKNNKNINSNQNHGDHCQHVQIGGQAYYDDRKYFLFPDFVIASPKNPHQRV